MPTDLVIHRQARSNLVALVGHVPRVNAHPGSPFHVHPCVADAMTLIQDVMRNVTDGQQTALMGAVEVGTIRLLCTEKVGAEVEEHLEEICIARGVDVDAAWEVWDLDHWPHLWVVNLPVGTVVDPRVNLVALEDPDDVPTAELALLLAATVLSDDQHLTRPGIAKPNWLSFAIHGRRAARTDENLYYAGMGTTFIGRLGFEAIKLAVRNPLPALGILGLATLARRSREPSGRPPGHGVWGSVKKVGELAMRGMEHTLAIREAAIAELVNAAVADPEPSEVVRAARLIARSPRLPVTAHDLASHLAAQEAPQSGSTRPRDIVTGERSRLDLEAPVASARRLLRSGPDIIREGPPGRFQIGTRGDLITP